VLVLIVRRQLAVMLAMEVLVSSGARLWVMRPQATGPRAP
jgi:hypothetical protein